MEVEMASKWRRVAAALLLLAMAPAGAQCTRVILSANPDYPPYHWAEGDRIVGASVALTGRILDELGVSWEARFVGPWPRVLKSAEFGEIDLVHRRDRGLGEDLLAVGPCDDSAGLVIDMRPPDLKVDRDH